MADARHNLVGLRFAMCAPARGMAPSPAGIAVATVPVGLGRAGVVAVVPEPRPWYW
ncbi:MAG: hypothetical protein WKF43_07795 [Acidimicrobiales bacterium]